jgi:hypothetical protein
LPSTWYAGWPLNLLSDPLAANAAAGVPAALADEFRANEALQRPVLPFSALNLRDVRADLLLPARLLVAPSVVGLREFDALPVHLGRRGLVAQWSSPHFDRTVLS